MFPYFRDFWQLLIVPPYLHLSSWVLPPVKTLRAVFVSGTATWKKVILYSLYSSQDRRQLLNYSVRQLIQEKRAVSLGITKKVLPKDLENNYNYQNKKSGNDLNCQRLFRCFYFKKLSLKTKQCRFFILYETIK